MGLISGWGRSPRGGHGNPLQYSCLQNPMDRGAWRATVHGVPRSRTRLKGLSTIAHSSVFMSVPVSPSSANSPLFPWVHMFVLYICVSISALEGGSSVGRALL